MSFYEPFYYPYFSARSELSPSLQELDRKIALNQYSRQPYSLIDEQVRLSQIDQYGNSAFVRAEMQRIGQERMIQAEMDAQIEMQKEDDYLQRIAALRRQRQLLDNMNKPIEYSARTRAQQGRQKQMTDDELLNYYSTGQKVQQYERQIKQRLNAQQKDQERKQRSAIAAAKLAYSQETQNSPKKIEKQKITQHRQQKQHKQQRQQRQQKQQRQQRQIRQLIERQKAKEEAIRRSYIEDLNESKGYSSIEKNYNKGQPLRGATLDVLDKSITQSPFKPKYGPNSKRKKGTKGSTSVYHGKNHNRNSSYIGGANNNKTFASNTINQAMKKINNRLKVSSIVYKDSKLRNQRHQIDHLSNTFENELKGRKQIRDKINNHPDILRKHKMVVNSK